MKYLRLSLLFFIAGLASVMLASNTSSMQDGTNEPDSVYCPGPYICFQSDTWAYYVTIAQLYDEFSIQYHVGEFGHIAAGDTLKELFTYNDRPDIWNIIYDVHTYVDTVRSMDFFVNPGDTIQFWHDLEIVYPVGTEPFSDIAFADTMEYIVDLVASGDGALLAHLKTTRVYPADSYVSLLSQIVDGMHNAEDGFIGTSGSGQPDSLKQLLLRRTVPASVSPQNAYIRVTPVFHGNYQERGLWRVDRAMQRRSESSKGLIQFFQGICDSLLLSGDTLSKVSFQAYARAIPLRQLHVWPDPSTGLVTVRRPSDHVTGETVILAVNAVTGEIVIRKDVPSTYSTTDITLDLRESAKGRYFIVLIGEDGFILHRLITIL
jgi:hypothetical protein